VAGEYEIVDRYGNKLGQARRVYDWEGAAASGLVGIAVAVAIGLFIAAGWLLWQAVKLTWRYPKVMLPILGGLALVAILGALLSSPPSRRPVGAAPVASAAPAPVATTAPVPAVVPASPPTPTRAPAGSWVAVVNTDDDGVFLRATPGGARKLVAWAEGARLEALGPEETVDGRRWRRVRDRAGTSGWVAAEYLAPAAAPAAPRSPAAADWVAVANTDGDGVFLRRTPRLDDRLAAWPDDTRLRVIGPDGEGDGRRWKRVRDPKGQEGWVPLEYVVPAYRADQ
jgi:SH3-like domain-containing protein